MRRSETEWRKFVPRPRGVHGERVRFEEGTLIGRVMARTGSELEILAEDRLGRLTGAEFRRDIADVELMPHELKTHRASFEAVFDARKRFEVRSTEDRQFWAGDTLVLEEYDADEGEYTERWTLVRVTYVLTGGNYGLPPELAVLSIEDAEPRIGDVYAVNGPRRDGSRSLADPFTLRVVTSVDSGMSPGASAMVQTQDYIRAPWGSSWWLPDDIGDRVLGRVAKDKPGA